MTHLSDLMYAAVFEAIRRGIRHVKGDDYAVLDITDMTSLWAGDTEDQPCLNLDSLDLLELVVFLERECGWSIPEEQIDAGGWHTVGDLASVVLSVARGVNPGV